MSRFRTASQILGLEEEVYNVLKVPARQVIVSLPVTMDDGSIRVFEGYRRSQGPHQGLPLGLPQAPDQDKRASSL